MCFSVSIRKNVQVCVLKKHKKLFFSSIAHMCGIVKEGIYTKLKKDADIFLDSK